MITMTLQGRIKSKFFLCCISNNSIMTSNSIAIYKYKITYCTNCVITFARKVASSHVSHIKVQPTKAVLNVFKYQNIIRTTSRTNTKQHTFLSLRLIIFSAFESKRSITESKCIKTIFAIDMIDSIMLISLKLDRRA